jgi:hypothetical protein
MSERRDELRVQFSAQIASGQCDDGEHSSRPQQGREAQQRVLKRHVMQCTDRKDRVVDIGGQRISQDISENAIHIVGCALPGNFDHRRATIDRVDVFDSVC